MYILLFHRFSLHGNKIRPPKYCHTFLTLRAFLLQIIQGRIVKGLCVIINVNIGIDLLDLGRDTQENAMALVWNSLG